MTTETLVRDILITVVWTLAISSFVQGMIHLVTWWVVHRQRSKTDVGIALNRRELTLGIKGLARTFFDALLILAISFNVDFDDDMGTLSPFFVILTTTAIVAIYYGIRYLQSLAREDWGKPVTSSSFSQDVADTIEVTADDVATIKKDVKQLQHDAQGDR